MYGRVADVARHGDLAGVTHARQRLSFECAHTLCLRTCATPRSNSTIRVGDLVDSCACARALLSHYRQ